MQRSPCHPFLASSLAFLSLIAFAILPLGSIANAAPASTNCPSTEGTECFLVISAPTSVPAGQTFTVIVDVTTDGMTVAKTDTCAKNAGVTLRLFIETEGESLVQSYFVNAKAGIATFNINGADFPNPGHYRLDAHVFLGEGTPPPCNSYFYQPDSVFFTAVNVPPGQPIEPCPPDTSCVQVTSGSGSAATLFADTGSFTASFGTLAAQGGGLGCNDGGPADPNGVLKFDYVGTDLKIVVISLKDPTKPANKYKICWESTIPFTQLSGGPAPSNGFFYVGYLPNCNKKNPVAPCVLDADNGKHHTASFAILAPSGDPLAYPE